jgi:hypothetical protein
MKKFSETVTKKNKPSNVQKNVRHIEEYVLRGKQNMTVKKILT